MSDQQWFLDRLHESYKEQNAKLFRTLTLALVFAVGGIWKVIEPLRWGTEGTALTRQTAEKLREELGGLEEELTELEGAYDAVESIRIDTDALAFEVRDATDSLKEDVPIIFHAEQLLRDQPAMIFLRVDPAVSLQDARLQQSPPPMMEQRTATTRPRSVEQLTPLRAQLRQQVPLRRTIDPQRLSRLETNAPPSDADRVDETPQISAEVQAAIYNIRLDPEDLRQLQDIAERSDGREPAREQEKNEFFERKTREALHARANEAIRTTANAVRLGAIDPLEQLAQIPQVQEWDPEIDASIADIRERVEQWERERVEDPNKDWLRTQDAKSQTLEDMARKMVQWSEECAQQVESAKDTARDRLQQQQSRLASDLAEHEASLQAEQEEMAKLLDEIDQVLPGWLRGIVSPRQLIQLFPWALPLLLGLVGLSAFKLRQLSAALESELARLQYRAGIPTNSLWTLRPKQGFPQAATAGLALLSLGTGLWAFHAGCRHLLAWRDLTDETVWRITGPTLWIAISVGYLAFVACGWGLVRSLTRDVPASGEVARP